MDFPEDLKQIVSISLTKKAEEEKRKSKLERERRLADKKVRQRNLKEGLPHAEFIFKWAKEFRGSEEGQKLIELCSWTFLGGIMFFDEKLDNFPWRGLGVSKDGLWWMRSGCGAKPNKVNSPKDLAVVIMPEILSAARDNIKSGRVWDCIKDRWELNHSLL